jgi:hypothetical protein
MDEQHSFVHTRKKNLRPGAPLGDRLLRWLLQLLSAAHSAARDARDGGRAHRSCLATRGVHHDVPDRARRRAPNGGAQKITSTGFVLRAVPSPAPAGKGSNVVSAQGRSAPPTSPTGQFVTVPPPKRGDLFTWVASRASETPVSAMAPVEPPALSSPRETQLSLSISANTQSTRVIIA